MAVLTYTNSCNIRNPNNVCSAQASVRLNSTVARAHNVHVRALYACRRSGSLPLRSHVYIMRSILTVVQSPSGHNHVYLMVNPS